MKKKIAIIGAKGLPAIGGAARAIESIVKYLSEEFELTIYEIDRYKKVFVENSQYKSIVFKGLFFKRFGTFFYYIKACLHALLRSNYDLIHTQHLYSGFIVPFLKIKYKVINTVRGIIPEDDDKWNALDIYFFRIFEKISLKFSDISVSVSKPQIEYLQSLTKKRIEYIPNGVDIDERLLQKRASIEKNYLIFSAARIIKLKGCHTFLKALKEIDFKGKIKIIGSLEHVYRYKKIIHNLAKGLDISFLGLIYDKEKLFNELLSAKVFIFPSIKEGLSNALLEVASLNIPIICSDIKENKAVFDDNEVLFFKTEDYKDLGEKILFALSHEDDLELMAARALSKLKKNYLWQDISKCYSKLYYQLLS